MIDSLCRFWSFFSEIFLPVIQSHAKFFNLKALLFVQYSDYQCLSAIFLSREFYSDNFISSKNFLKTPQKIFALQKSFNCRKFAENVYIHMQEINFINESVAMPDFDSGLVSRWIGKVAASFDKSVGHLTYIFCDDARIIEVNRQFLNHDYYTDIITFDNSRRGIISGDMYISLDTVASNAALLGKSYDEEFYRVVIHGVLHLCGINDKGPGEREIMEANEDRALQILDALRNEI